MRGIALALGAAGVVAAVVLGPSQATAWDAVQAHLAGWRARVDRNLFAALTTFYLVFGCAASLPFPVLTVMTLLGGALFGVPLGLLASCLAYTTGVTVSFLATRVLFRDRVRRTEGKWLSRVQRGVERDGAYYLFTLRMMPTVPFFLVNVLMALTPIRTRTFAAVSCLGVLPYAFLSTRVGAELASVESPDDIVSPQVLAALAALAVVPLLIRRAFSRREAAGVGEPK
ncbi:TVP38/TMEM64 family protein [Gemmata sp.]|uniref:TVP38/TMEM64 family protein n=1 Tax=Gemmata sp. TaxID=1914242 RepID=UPI003F6EF765